MTMTFDAVNDALIEWSTLCGVSSVSVSVDWRDNVPTAEKVTYVRPQPLIYIGMDDLRDLFRAGGYGIELGDRQTICGAAFIEVRRPRWLQVVTLPKVDD